MFCEIPLNHRHAPETRSCGPADLPRTRGTPRRGSRCRGVGDVFVADSAALLGHVLTVNQVTIHTGDTFFSAT